MASAFAGPDKLPFSLRVERRLSAVATPWFYVVVTIALFGVWTARLAMSGELSGPPRNTGGDEPDYDCIAYHVWKKGAFAVDYRDSGFLAPYVEAESRNEEGVPYPETVAGRLPGATTYRPPLMPVLLAATYSVAGREYSVIRILNVLVGAITVGVASWICRRAVGATASLICLGLMIWLGGIQRMSVYLMTENWSALFVTLTLWVMALRLPVRPVSSAVVIGLLLSAGVLTRTGLILWLPGLVIGIGMIVFSTTPGSYGRRFYRAMINVVISISVMSAALTPWVIRNCAVLDAFMPLGCQGYVELPAGFSDAAVSNSGLWKAWQGPPLLPQPHTLPEAERALALRNRGIAIDWIKSHPAQLPKLTLNKLWGEWKPNSTAMAFVMCFALIGMPLVRTRTFGYAGISILLGNAFMIVATWSVGGRFTYPIMAVWFGFAGAGGWGLIRLLTDLRHVALTQP